MYTRQSRCPPFLFISDEHILKQSKKGCYKIKFIKSIYFFKIHIQWFFKDIQYCRLRNRWTPLRKFGVKAATFLTGLPLCLLIRNWWVYVNPTKNPTCPANKKKHLPFFRKVCQTLVTLKPKVVIEKIPKEVCDSDHRYSVRYCVHIHNCPETTVFLLIRDQLKKKCGVTDIFWNGSLSPPPGLVGIWDSSDLFACGFSRTK